MNKFVVTCRIKVFADNKTEAVRLASVAMEYYDLETDEIRIDGCGGAQGSVEVSPA